MKIIKKIDNRCGEELGLLNFPKGPPHSGKANHSRSLGNAGHIWGVHGACQRGSYLHSESFSVLRYLRIFFKLTLIKFVPPEFFGSLSHKSLCLVVPQELRLVVN